MLVRPLGIETSRQKELLKKSHRKRALLHLPGTVLAVTLRSPRTERSEMTPEQHQIDQLLEYLVDQIARNKNYSKNNDFLEGLYDQLIRAVGPQDCGETYEAGRC